jgi:hypothetical protein
MLPPSRAAGRDLGEHLVQAGLEPLRPSQHSDDAYVLTITRAQG